MGGLIVERYPVVVGGGRAGLAMGWYLRERGTRDHRSRWSRLLIFFRGNVSTSWFRDDLHKIAIGRDPDIAGLSVVDAGGGERWAVWPAQFS